MDNLTTEDLLKLALLELECMSKDHYKPLMIDNEPITKVIRKHLDIEIEDC